MHYINSIQEFGIRNLSNAIKVNTIISNLSINNESQIEVDLRNCLIAYPETGRIFNKLYALMSEAAGQKSLKIYVSGFNELEKDLLCCLFNESAFCNNRDLTQMDLNEIKSEIKKTTQAGAIKIEIITFNAEEKPQNTFIYDL
jgi:hypothetical protein